MEFEECRMCGGDGRVGNALAGGGSARCPSCHGTGRRSEAPRFHDVTKTKESHYRPAVQAAPAGPKVPVTPEGEMLAREVSASAALAPDAKARLIAEIVAHESTHGRCTKTFIKKLRKQTRPAG